MTTYQTPKTNWASTDGVTNTDLNRIEGNTQANNDLANSKYTKPGTGIPKTDLESAVQTSLSKADSSYQKPGSGIPKTDLDSATQTSLSKADGAVQSSSVGQPSGIGSLDATGNAPYSQNRKNVEQTDYETYKSNKDINGVFTTVQYKRNDGTLAIQSVLSGGTSPQYTTRTITYYGTDGSTVEKTTTRTLSYDTDGDLTSEV